ncbi:hypothetical protein STEG23_036183 [Scotinomys teguina]
MQFSSLTLISAVENPRQNPLWISQIFPFQPSFPDLFLCPRHQLEQVILYPSVVFDAVEDYTGLRIRVSQANSMAQLIKVQATKSDDLKFQDPHPEEKMMVWLEWKLETSCGVDSGEKMSMKLKYTDILFYTHTMGLIFQRVLMRLKTGTQETPQNPSQIDRTDWQAYENSGLCLETASRDPSHSSLEFTGGCRSSRAFSVCGVLYPCLLCFLALESQGNNDVRNILLPIKA